MTDNENKNETEINPEIISIPQEPIPLFIGGPMHGQMAINISKKGFTQERYTYNYERWTLMKVEYDLWIWDYLDNHDTRIEFGKLIASKFRPREMCGYCDAMAPGANCTCKE